MGGQILLAVEAIVIERVSYYLLEEFRKVLRASIGRVVILVGYLHLISTVVELELIVAILVHLNLDVGSLIGQLNFDRKLGRVRRFIIRCF